jgi:hypothetical protein
MIRRCSKCQQGTMYSETGEIPREIPLPILGAISFSIERFIPEIMRSYRKYTVFICDTCGNLEFAVSRS